MMQRAFPQDPEAERAVLASIALAPMDCRTICAEMGIDGGTFYLPAHRLIFEAQIRIIDSGKTLDFITLAQRLRDDGNLEKVGGPALLNELYVLLPSAANVRQYAEIVREKYFRRRAIEIGTELAQRGYEPGDNTGELVADAHGKLGLLMGTKGKRKSVAESLQEIVDEVRDGRDESGLLATGVDGVDKRLLLYRGDLLIVSAPTSCGKTALSAQMAWGVAMAGGRVAVYPLEMAQKRMLRRAIAQLGGMNADFVRSVVVRQRQGLIGEDKAAKIVADFMATARTIKNLKLHVRDDVSNWEQIRADLRTEHAREPFAFVMIDYLQLIKTQRQYERRQLAIAEITQGAKLLAKELDCVICMPSQVNKEGGTREAQDAENDADALVKIHPEEDQNGDVRPGRVSVWKQREGERHIDLPLTFNGLLTRFEYRDQPSQPNC